MKDDNVTCGFLVSHQNKDSVGQLARVINSIVEGDVTLTSGAVVQHCHLQVSEVKLLPLDSITLSFWFFLVVPLNNVSAI